MASGSFDRSAACSKGFDFRSDDVLCSYDNFSNQEASNEKRSDSAIGGSSGKDFRDGRMGRLALNLYNQQDESFNQDVLSIVERTMKKHSDNLLRFLEGISGRLSQLELYCYNLERSIGDFRSNLIRDHNEADLKLRSLEKHLQEAHRSIQILRDKQEIADAQKEIAKFQLAQKESLHHNEEAGVSSTESKKHENAFEAQSQQLALALPQQTTVPTSLPVPIQPYKELPVQQQPVPSMPPQQQVHVQTLPNTYYPEQNQLPSQPPQMDQHMQVGLQQGNGRLDDGVLRKLVKADWKDSFEMIINRNQRASRMKGWGLFLPGGKVHAEATPKKASNVTDARGSPKHICRSAEVDKLRLQTGLPKPNGIILPIGCCFYPMVCQSSQQVGGLLKQK